MKAFVLDTDKTPLSPCDAARARKLLDKGKAAIYRRYPFTIILKRKVDRPKPKPLRFKVDPGSKITGMAIIDDSTGDVVWCAELEHRGQQIVNDLLTSSFFKKWKTWTEDEISATTIFEPLLAERMAPTVIDESGLQY